MKRESVAVIGAGVSGLTAAYVLARTHDVVLLEADTRYGGHAHTHRVAAAGAQVAVDSGFIVHNDRTYPVLQRLFADLDVPTRATEMSMSVSCQACGLEYAGGTGGRGLLAQPTRLADRRYVRMLHQVTRFHRAARALLADPHAGDPTWGEFLAQGRFDRYMVSHFATPLVSCVWSSGDVDAMAYPARHLFAFLANHGMLSVGDSPAWRTVVGGSQVYVERVIDRLPATRLQAPVTAVTRHAAGVDVVIGGGETVSVDRVVVATHADQALDLLADASADEKAWLGAIRYSRNETWLHRDAAVLPRSTRAKASWNHRISACDQTHPQVQVSYWMNRLMGLPGEGQPGQDLLVTLNPRGLVDEATVIARMVYEHPVFTHDAIAAAQRLRDAGGPRLAFAGAHLGWGFHEDGARSGLAAAERLGGSW